MEETIPHCRLRTSIKCDCEFMKKLLLRLGTQDVNGEHFTRNKGEEVTIFIHKIHNG